MNEQKQLLRALQQYSFAVTEAVLYLDLHPRCREALRFWEKYRRLYLETRHRYEEKYGSLTMYGGAADAFTWVEEPWPWERSAN